MNRVVEGNPVENAAVREDAGVSIAGKGAAGRVMLSRSSRRNALTVEMRRALAAAFRRFARDPVIYAAVVRSESDSGAFCSGADLRELIELTRGDRAKLRAALGEALALCWQLECFSKPTVSLINGAVMGGGVGISLFGTHRVAGADYAFRCPETAVGLAPANGQSYALSRMPHSIGVYLALTGDAIGRADAFALGLVSHCIEAARFAEIERQLADADPVDAVLDGLHADPGPGRLMALAPVIARCFAAPSVEEIIARLEAERGTHEAWAREAAGRMRRSSPLALKVTHRLLEAATGMDLRTALQLEYRAICRLAEGLDFQAGAQAVLSHGTSRPIWQPSSLEAVPVDMAVRVLAHDVGLDLALPSRDQMQAARY
jgi:enoyl-CoA hydratase/carnithine racemase